MATDAVQQVQNYPLNIALTPTALQSWISTTNRLLKTLRGPCGHRGYIRRGMLLCSACHRGWPLDDIQDLIAETEALPVSSVTASSRVTARENVPSLSTASPGCTVSKRLREEQNDHSKK